MRMTIRIYKANDGRYAFRYIGELGFIHSIPNYKQIRAAYLFCAYLNGEYNGRKA